MDEMKNNHHNENSITELGSDLSQTSKGNIYTLTIVGQIEGHQVLPETVKTTKYEHILPLLAGLEESDEIDGLLLLLNTVGGDIEAGLAIAVTREAVARRDKDTHDGGQHFRLCREGQGVSGAWTLPPHPTTGRT